MPGTITSFLVILLMFAFRKHINFMIIIIIALAIFLTSLYLINIYLKSRPEVSSKIGDETMESETLAENAHTLISTFNQELGEKVESLMSVLKQQWEKR